MIQIDAVVKYENETKLSLDIPKGVTVLLGEVGSYKSSILKVIGGVAIIESGSVILDGKNIEELPPKERDMMLVGAETVPTSKGVLKALMQPLKLRGMGRKEAAQRARLAAEKFGLDLGGCVKDDLKAFFGARMSLRETAVTMFDEPYHFFGEDATEFIKGRKSEYVIVTSSDGEDVRRLSPDFLIVLRKGKVLQSGTPCEVSSSPSNRYVDLLVNM